jgi:alpha-L-fucosidase
VEYKGVLPRFDLTKPLTISASYPVNTCEAVFGQLKGSAKLESITFSHYFGDWKNATCVTNLSNPDDAVTFTIRVTEKSDYKIVLEYACAKASSNQEGVVEINNADFRFRTLHTSEYDQNEPLLFIRHPVAIVSIGQRGVYTVRIRPENKGVTLFNLKAVLLEPVH